MNQTTQVFTPARRPRVRLMSLAVPALLSSSVAAVVLALLAALSQVTPTAVPALPDSAALERPAQEPDEQDRPDDLQGWESVA